MRWRSRFLFFSFAVISLSRKHATQDSKSDIPAGVYNIHTLMPNGNCISRQMWVPRYSEHFIQFAFFHPGLYGEIITILLLIGNTTVKYYLFNLKE